MNKDSITRPEIPHDHPIITALRLGDAETVKHYLDNGISPYSLGLLSGAIESGNVDIVQAFLDHGMEVNFVFNIHGETPILRAIEKKQMSVLKLLIEKGANINICAGGWGTPLHAAAEVWPEAISVLLNAGAMVNVASSHGRTPVMGAAFRNQIYALELLRSAGGNLEDCDNEGTTPLILAARAGKREAIDWLLNNGADILVSDHNGKTAEDWAKENGHIEVVELLQSRIRS